jgi:hypothetical protein
MISELTLAMTHKVPLEVLAETVHCYPTQAEVFRRIALEYVKTRKTAAREAGGRRRRTRGPVDSGEQAPLIHGQHCQGSDVGGV